MFFVQEEEESLCRSSMYDVLYQDNRRISTGEEVTPWEPGSGGPCLNGKDDHEPWRESFCSP